MLSPLLETLKGLFVNVNSSEHKGLQNRGWKWVYNIYHSYQSLVLLKEYTQHNNKS